MSVHGPMDSCVRGCEGESYVMGKCDHRVKTRIIQHGRFSLFITERFHRIEVRGRTGRQITGETADHEQYRRYDPEAHWIMSRNSLQTFLQQFGQEECAEHADCKHNNNQAHPMARNE